MERPNTIAGLMTKRAEIAGQVRDLRDKLAAATADLEHLDATIRMFDPDGAVPLRKPPRKFGPDAAFKGEMRRYVLQAFREASGPVTSLEIALYVANAQGHDTSNRARVTTIRKRVNACVYKLVQKGLVREIEAAGEYKKWRLATISGERAQSDEDRVAE